MGRLRNSITNISNNTLQAFWVGIGGFSSFALGIISAAVLSRYLGKAEYGTYRQILYVYNTLIVIFSAGLPRVFAYFLPRYGIDEGKSIVWKVSKVLMLAGVLFSVFLFLFSEIIAQILNNPELSKGLKIFSPVPMLLLPTLGIEGVFSTYRKTAYIAIYNFSTRIVMLVCIVVPVIVFNGTYLIAVIGWIVASIFTFIVAIYFKGIPFKKVLHKDTSLTLKEIFTYSLPLVSASAAGMAIRSADQFYISRYFGVETFAEFANGFIQLPFVTMVTGATSIVLMPLFSKMIHDKVETTKITTLWSSALEKSAIIIYPIVVFFILNAKITIVLLYSEAYIVSAKFFQIALIINFFNIVVVAPFLLSLGETKFYARLHLAFTGFIWIGGFIVIKTINTPIAIAILSATTSIATVIVSLRKVSTLLGISFTDLLPIKHFFKISIHSLFVVIVLKTVDYLIVTDFSLLTTFIFHGVSYVFLVLLTSRIIGIDYLISFRSILSIRK